VTVLSVTPSSIVTPRRTVIVAGSNGLHAGLVGTEGRRGLHSVTRGPRFTKGETNSHCGSYALPARCERRSRRRKLPDSLRTATDIRREGIKVDYAKR
jgi:hypothetical protein